MCAVMIEINLAILSSRCNVTMETGAMRLVIVIDIVIKFLKSLLKGSNYYLQ